MFFELERFNLCAERELEADSGFFFSFPFLEASFLFSFQVLIVKVISHQKVH